jgi:hypothetical protein
MQQRRFTIGGQPIHAAVHALEPAYTVRGGFRAKADSDSDGAVHRRGVHPKLRLMNLEPADIFGRGGVWRARNAAKPATMRM